MGLEPTGRHLYGVNPFNGEMDHSGPLIGELWFEFVDYEEGEYTYKKLKRVLPK